MQIYLKEKIGNPELFTGRKKEMFKILQWIDNIQREISMSTVILSRRKTGKTSFLQRLYNVTFHKNDGVIPFYYEIKEENQYIIDFSKHFFLSFIFQYIAFKTRNPSYLNYSKQDYDLAVKCAQKEKQDHLIPFITDIRLAERNKSPGFMWDIARDAPRLIAQCLDERIVQMLDEFQYLNRKIYSDTQTKKIIDDLAASYLHTVEYKNAPLLITGSWIGWLMTDISTMLPGRLVHFPFENLSENESIEMIFRYADIEQSPVTEKSAYLMASLTEGNPFYICSLFRSQCPEKNLTTKEGIIKTLEFEIMNQGGIIKNTWSEYLNFALDEVNSIHAKRIVLYLSQHKSRKVPRYELVKELHLDMPERELEKKLKTLIMSDIVNSGGSRYTYQAVQDNIFEKVFIAEFGGDIEYFDPQRDISNNYQQLMTIFENKFKKIQGKLNQTTGLYAEYVLIDLLKYRAFQNKYNKQVQALFENLPEDFTFVQYERVWTYSASPLYKKNIQIDIFAKAKKECYSLIGEVKKRKKPFSVKEAQKFLEKASELISIEKLGMHLLFVYSAGGFYKNTIEFLKKHKIAWCQQKHIFAI